MICVGEWFIKDYFIKGGITYKEIASQLFVCAKTVYRTSGRLRYDVKPYRLGRPTGSASLFNHEESIHNGLYSSNNLHEITNYITSATGSSFRPQTLCDAVHMLGMTRKNVVIEPIEVLNIGWLLTNIASCFIVSVTKILKYYRYNVLLFKEMMTSDSNLKPK